GDPTLHLVAGLVDASMQSLARVGEMIEPARLAAVVRALAKAELIHLVGSKRAFPVTTYLSLALAQLGIANLLVDNVGSTAFAKHRQAKKPLSRTAGREPAPAKAGGGERKRGG